MDEAKPQRRDDQLRGDAGERAAQSDPYPRVRRAPEELAREPAADSPAPPANGTSFSRQVRFVLLDPEDRLRAGWRLAAHAVGLVAALVVGMLAALAVLLGAGALGWHALGTPASVVELGVQTFALFAATVAAVVLSAVLLDGSWSPRFQRGTLADAGLSLHPARALLESVLGIGVAALALSITVGAMAVGGMKVAVPGMDLAAATHGVAVGGILVAAAAFEELLFRGYLFQWIGGALARLGHWALGAKSEPSAAGESLVESVAFGGPALALSALFGLVHLMNPAVTWLSTVNTVLAGMWLAVLLLRTRSLWPSIAAHWAWNALTLLGLGLPVSGFGEESGFVVASLLDLDATGPAWLSGGAYGPEGSVGCTLGLLVAIAVSSRLPRRSPEDGFAAARRVLPRGRATHAAQ